MTTPLAKKYARMVKMNLILPAEETDHYEYPSVLHEVPTTTTSDVGVLNAGDFDHARLGTNPTRNYGD